MDSLGRPKGRKYISLSISVSPEQMRMLEDLPNQSAMIRGLLDYYLKTWHPLVAEYLGIIKDIEAHSSYKTEPMDYRETSLFELMKRTENPENAARYDRHLIQQLDRLRELERQIPREILPFESARAEEP